MKTAEETIDALELVIQHEGRPYASWSIGLLGIHGHNQRDKVGPTTRPVYKCSPGDAKKIFDHFVGKGVVPIGEYQSDGEGIFLHR